MCSRKYSSTRRASRGGGAEVWTWHEGGAPDRARSGGRRADLEGGREEVWAQAEGARPHGERLRARGPCAGRKLEIPVTLIDAYEAKHHPIDPPDPIDAIRPATSIPIVPRVLAYV